MRRFLTLLTLAAGLLAAGSASAFQAGDRVPAARRPRLLVVLVLDQFPEDIQERYAPWLGSGGFNWLRRSGAHLTDAHYGHATTYTGPGHALILSGAYGHVSGIIGNRWWNRAANRTESMFFDPQARLLGLEASPRDDDTSPRNFAGSNLSDQLRLASGMKSKAFGISNKDRAAIMLAGKLGRAFWFHEGAGGMTSSTYYGQELPGWLTEFNAWKLPDSYFGKRWEKRLPEAAYAISHADDVPWETDFRGLGRTFPHLLTDKSGKPGPEFYEAFTATPFGTEYQLELARTLIEREELGRDEHPDLLGISLTATDICGHAYGPNSHEMQDLVVRTDEQLAGFFRYLNGRFRPGEVAIALTSDHGVCPVPEYLASLGMDAGRVKRKALGDAIEAALTARYGAPGGDAKWILALEDPGVFLNRAVLSEKRLDSADVQRAAGEAALGIRGIAGYFTRAQFTSGQLPPNQWARMFERSFHPERSGDVLLMTRPHYFWGSYGDRDTGTTHGSPYRYDTHVPIMLMGPGIRPGEYRFRADVADFAPTLAALLRVNPPAGSEGRVLHEIFR